MRCVFPYLRFYFGGGVRRHFSVDRKSPTVIAKFCGRVPYADALQLQEVYVKRHLSAGNKNSSCSAENILLMLEHNPVYTVGIRTQDYSDLEEKRLRGLGAEFFRTDRGGLITFHGPGQLVVYPILNLASFSGTIPGTQTGVRWYVDQLEKTLIRMCQEGFELETQTSPHTGVWTRDERLVAEKKVAAIGIHVKGGITSHGLALNCNTDLAWFENIVPCGIEGKGVTSLSQELGRDVKIEHVLEPFCRAFATQFECDVVRNL